MGIHGIGAQLMAMRNGDFKVQPAEYKLLECEYNLEGPFFKAVIDGKFDSVRFLLDAGMDPNMIHTTMCGTPLGHACSNGQLQIAKLLRSRGAQLVMFYEDQTSPTEPTGALLNSATSEARAWLRSCPPEGEECPTLKNPPGEGVKFSDVEDDRIEGDIVALVEIWQESRRIAKDEEKIALRLMHLEKKRKLFADKDEDGACSSKRCCRW